MTYDSVQHKGDIYGIGTCIRKHYSEVPNRRADRNKQAGLEKNASLVAYLLS